MEYIPGTVNQRPRPTLVAPPSAPSRRPVPPVPSHRGTTCNFWARGDCRYTDEECQYAHSWTDLAGGQPNIYHPGRSQGPQVPQVPPGPQMAGLNTRSTTANTQVPQGILQPAFSNMHIQQGNMLSAARNRQARQGNMQPSPSRPQIPQDATLLNPERLVRQSRGNSDPRGSSDLGRLSLLGRFDPAAAAFEPQDLRELRLERDRSQAFYNSMNDEVGLFLKLSEELETTMVDLRRLSTEVKDVAERIQNRPVDLQLQVSKLRELATEIEAMAATHETWNAVIAKNIQDAAECWARWERPPGRRPWL